MRYPLKYTRLVLVLSAIAAAIACRKASLPACTGNCGIIDFSGRVYDRTNNQPLANQNITVTYTNSRPCLICTIVTMVSGKTTSDGSFYLSTTIDTTLSKYNDLVISVTRPANYIEYPLPTGPDILPDNSHSSSRLSAYSNMVSRHNLDFGFFPTAPLTMNLHRTTPIIASYPFAFFGLTLVPNLPQSTISLIQSATNKDTSFTIITAANFFTKINSQKNSTPTSIATTTDSIKCVAGVNNKIDIYY